MEDEIERVTTRLQAVLAERDALAVENGRLKERISVMESAADSAVETKVLLWAILKRISVNLRSNTTSTHRGGDADHAHAGSAPGHDRAVRGNPLLVVARPGGGGIGRSPAPVRLCAWALVALATVAGWGPVRILLLLDHPLPAVTENILQVAAMMLMIAAAIMWSAARAYVLAGRVRRSAGASASMSASWRSAWRWRRCFGELE